MDSVKMMVGNKEMELTHHEMKEVADKYWEHWGKHSMLSFAEKMKHKAAGNIADALDTPHKPLDEYSVKNAIADAFCTALEDGDWDMLAEVIYEAAEMAAACFTIYQIKDSEK